MLNEYIADDIIVSLYKKKKTKKKPARQNEIAQFVVYDKNAQA